MADRHVIARHVVGFTPYYISHYSALELNQMTTQPVNTIYVTVPRQRANRPIAGVEYRFVYANQRVFGDLNQPGPPSKSKCKSAT
jgi:predicted transcriptional regulator of viral defense system